MFEQVFKNIDNVLRKDSGVGTELDYIEQTSWVLFLKYLDDLETAKKIESDLAGKKYEAIIDPKYRWQNWAVPKNNDGKINHQDSLTGDDLKDFVNDELFPYLRKFKSKNIENPDTIEYKIGEIFSELKNKLHSGYRLREILEEVDKLHFQTQKEKHELTHLYESKLKQMGNAGRNGGEYYTPRPLIKAIIEVVKPQIGETVYDGACGSGGFLAEAFLYMSKEREKLSPHDWDVLQKKTFYGKELKSLAYIVGTMNLILHGIEAPNIKHMNTLSENIMDIQEKDRYDVILANPPFGAGVGRELQQNFPIKSGETAYLFLQHFIKSLKVGGRAGIVIKNTFLSNGDAKALRGELLKSCNLYAVLDLPRGAFQAGINTVVLFFEKGKSTKNIWYYQLNLDRNLGKTNPLNSNDLEEFVRMSTEMPDSDNSWSINIEDIDQDSFDLSVKNPNQGNGGDSRSARELLAEISDLSAKSDELISKIGKIINE